jgi:hypothetical protein
LTTPSTKKYSSSEYSTDSDYKDASSDSYNTYYSSYDEAGSKCRLSDRNDLDQHSLKHQQEAIEASNSNLEDATTLVHFSEKVRKLCSCQLAPCNMACSAKKCKKCCLASGIKCALTTHNVVNLGFLKPLVRLSLPSTTMKTPTFNFVAAAAVPAVTSPTLHVNATVAVPNNNADAVVAAVATATLPPTITPVITNTPSTHSTLNTVAKSRTTLVHYSSNQAINNNNNNNTLTAHNDIASNNTSSSNNGATTHTFGKSRSLSVYCAALSHHQCSKASCLTSNVTSSRSDIGGQSGCCTRKEVAFVHHDIQKSRTPQAHLSHLVGIKEVLLRFIEPRRSLFPQAVLFERSHAARNWSIKHSSSSHTISHVFFKFLCTYICICTYI